MKRPERVAAVDKIEDQREPEDFIGHRNRTPVLLSAKGGKVALCDTESLYIKVIFDLCIQVKAANRNTIFIFATFIFCKNRMAYLLNSIFQLQFN